MKTAYILLGLALLTTAHASLAESVSLKTAPFNESFRQAANISGLLVVGAVAVQAQPVVGPKLQASIPSAWAGHDMCARVISANGLVEAVNLYGVDAGWQGGIVEIPFVTKEPKRWNEIPSDQVAALLTEGLCGDTVNSIAPAFWNDAPTTLSNPIRVLINSFGADEVYFFTGDDPLADSEPCRKIIADVRTAFDFECDVVTLVGKDTSIELRRVRSGSVEPPEFLTLVGTD